MNIKTITASILGATILIATFFVAKPWAQENRSNNGVSNVPSVTPTPFPEVPLEELRGINVPELTYLEHGTLYRSKPNDPNERVTRKRVLEGVDRIFDQRGSVILVGKNVQTEEEIATYYDLWVADMATGRQNKVSSSAQDAAISPQGSTIVVHMPGNEIHLLDKGGKFLKKIGTYGGWPVFSPDGGLLAYSNFVDSDFESNQGIAVYNIETGKESVLTNADDSPVAFSLDGKKLYFNSFRTSVLSLWVLDLATNNASQVTNKGPISGYVPPTLYSFDPYMVGRPLQSSNGSILVSGGGDGIGILKFNALGDVVSAQIIEGGTNPRWAVEDSIVAYRTKGGQVGICIC